MPKHSYVRDCAGEKMLVAVLFA